MTERPLEGIRVVEMSHVVMGPFCGMVLAQLGAEVIKVEPLDGDPTRKLQGMAISFFPLFNAGKKSIALDLQSPEGQAAVHRLLETADVFLENFKDSTISVLGLDSGSLHERYPDLIIAAHKGYLSGPYENRPALDEVVQMMTGLAAMTGTREQPLRVGASMNDMMGGLFGVVGILAALLARGKGGSARQLRIGLFENCLLAVSQHMVQYQITGIEPPPLSQRIHAWPVYDRFQTRDDHQIFVAATTEGHWRALCDEFGLSALLSDPRLRSVPDRVAARDWTLPVLAEEFVRHTREEIMEKLERRNLPFAPINSPAQMFDDPHVQRPGGLIQLQREGEDPLLTPALPIEFDGAGLTAELAIPTLGAHNTEVLSALGYSEADIRILSGSVAA